MYFVQYGVLCRAVARLVSCRVYTAADPVSNTGQIMWELWWTERHWECFLSSTSISFKIHSFH
jgi:hypothetical protein